MRAALQRYGGGAFWIAAQEATTSLLGLALMVVLTRTFTKDLLGQYTLILGVVGLAGIFRLAGISNAIMQSVARGFDATFRHGVAWVLRWSLVGSALILAYGAQQIWAAQTQLGTALLIAGGLFPLAHGLEQWTAYYSGKEDFRRAATLRMAMLATTNIAVIAAVLIRPSTIVTAVLALCVVRGAFNVRYTREILETIDRTARPEEGAIRYGLWTALYGSANTLANHIDKVFLFYFVSAEALAVYAVASKLSELVKQGLRALTVVWVPTFSRMERLTRTAERKIDAVGLGLVALILGLAFLVVPWALPLVFAGYNESVLYCQLLLGSVSIGILATLKYTYLRSKLDTASFRNVHLISNAARIAAVVALVPTLGLLGAAFSAVIYRIVLLAVTDVNLEKHRQRDA